MGSAPGLQSRAAEHPVTAGTAPKAERRHLRVLFCDLVPIPHVSGSRPNVPGIKRVMTRHRSRLRSATPIAASAGQARWDWEAKVLWACTVGIRKQVIRPAARWFADQFRGDGRALCWAALRRGRTARWR